MAEFLIKYGYQNYTVTVDDEDHERVSRQSWNILKRGNIYYARTTIRRKTVRLHRFILGLRHNDGIKVDHKDHNGLNNRKENLRIATITFNNANRQKQLGCSSQYKGVSWDISNKKWKVSIRVHYKLRHLGCFTDEIQAARAYDKAALEAFGEFALVNGV